MNCTLQNHKKIFILAVPNIQIILGEFKQKIYNLTTELVQIFDCCCQEMFIGRQIEIQNDWRILTKKFQKRRKANEDVWGINIMDITPRC